MSKSNPSPFSTATYRANPYSFYQQMRNESPVCRTVLPNGIEVYLVTRYDDVRAALKNERLVSNIYNARSQGWRDKLSIASLLGITHMLKSDPPEHTRLRGLAHTAFTPKYVSEIRTHIQQMADQLLDAVQVQGKMDLVADFAFPLPIEVISEILGVPKVDHPKFRKWSTAIIDSDAIADEKGHRPKEMLLLYLYISRLVDLRRKLPKNDLVSQLIRAEENSNRLSKKEVIGTIVLLLLGGHETTMNLIADGMLALLQHPEQFEKLRQDPTLIKTAIEEITRFVSPVQATQRYASVDLDIGGITIHKGGHVVLSLAGANHDPAYLLNPEIMDVANSDSKHLAFGQGIHYCLGAPLARLEGEIAFTTLLRRMPNMKLAAATEDLAWRPSFGLRGLSSLPVFF